MNQLQIVPSKRGPSHSMTSLTAAPLSSSLRIAFNKQPSHSLGDKLQLLALIRPNFLTILEFLVDKMIANAITPNGGKRSRNGTNDGW